MLIFQKILCRFSDVFRGDRTGTLVQNRLILKARSVSAIIIFFNMTECMKGIMKKGFSIHVCLSGMTILLKRYMCCGMELFTKIFKIFRADF